MTRELPWAHPEDYPLRGLQQPVNRAMVSLGGTLRGRPSAKKVPGPECCQPLHVTTSYKGSHTCRLIRPQDRSESSKPLGTQTDPDTLKYLKRNVCEHIKALRSPTWCSSLCLTRCFLCPSDSASLFPWDACYLIEWHSTDIPTPKKGCIFNYSHA